MYKVKLAKDKYVCVEGNPHLWRFVSGPPSKAHVMNKQLAETCLQSSMSNYPDACLEYHSSPSKMNSSMASYTSDESSSPSVSPMDSPEGSSLVSTSVPSPSSASLYSSE